MIIQAKHLVTGDGKTSLQDAAIKIQDGKIYDLGPASQLKEQNPEEKVIDYGEATILPGLFDMHEHMGYYFSQPNQQEYDDFLIAYYAQKQASEALAKGVTTVRDLGAAPHGLLKRLRMASQLGYLKAPRIIHADSGICMTGGHGHEDGEEEVDGPWHLRSVIRRQLRDGADWIKILTSNRTDVPEFTQEELDAAVDECHRRNVKIAVHAGTPIAIQMCIDAGFDTIEHGTFMTLAQAEQMVKNGQAWTPTITAYTYLYEFCQRQLKENKSNSDNPIAARAMHDIAYFKPAAFAYRDNFKKFYDTGITVLAGTDMVLYGAPALPIDLELGYMVQYGITPLQAIQTATVNPARVLGLSNVTGKLEKGLEADVLVVKGDASVDITALSHVLSVYLGGKKVVENPSIDS
ncbi:MAG: amidohydrolase family protein [Oscillospiraceae bacterium]|jgi:imidazolonepropionase-like amidohydrolase|nr:amidohydrolase family protein [Oscillospiraceae bacterium]MCI2191643.1 amidohydrolase family protein [Oscillospiraceae bacterium]